MRLALARALFVQPALLLLDEPTNHIDLNALAWLEDYLQTWPGTLLVVSHDRAFLDAVATDIVHQHSHRLDYYRGNFSQFYATKSERDRNLRKEYDAQVEYRAHLQAFIDRWRYNANRAAQAQSKIKILEKLPELEPPEVDESETFKFADAEKLSPPMLQLSGVTFGYDPEKPILKNIDFDLDLDSRMAIVGANGAGKSTLIKLLMGDLTPNAGLLSRNGRLRMYDSNLFYATFADPTYTVATLPNIMSMPSFRISLPSASSHTSTQAVQNRNTASTSATSRLPARQAFSSSARSPVVRRVVWHSQRSVSRDPMYFYWMSRRTI
jgi:ATP-binding cassette subfamily F protein 3